MLQFNVRTPIGSVWPAVPRDNNSMVWARFLELERTQWLEPAEIEKRQLAQIRALLAHCQEHVPYYQDLLRETNIAPATIETLDDFRRIPILQRQTFQQQFTKFQATALPPSMKLTQKARTSGTSGMPIHIWRTNHVDAWWLAFLLRDAQWCGFQSGGRLASIRAIHGSEKMQEKFMNGANLANWAAQVDAIIESGPAFGMNYHQTPQRQLEWLRSVEPDYLISYPMNLHFLADLIAAGQQPVPSLKVIQAIGATVTKRMHRHIERHFGAALKSTYSCEEAGYIATPCPEDDGTNLHVHAENLLLEVLDDDGDPCKVGEVGRVVITALHNYLTPFIRYEILDGVRLGPAKCSCGRGLPVLSEVIGRRRAPMRLPNGKQKNSGWLVEQLSDIGGYLQHQIIQRTVDHVVIRLVPAHDWKDENRARIEQSVMEYFETPIQVEVRLEESLGISGRGKLRDVFSELEK